MKRESRPWPIRANCMLGVQLRMMGSMGATCVWLDAEGSMGEICERLGAMGSARAQDEKFGAA